MTTKSPLERDIESREMIKLPLSALVFIAFLSICLGVLGVYTYTLRQELMLSRQELAIAQDSADKRIGYLMDKVSSLERESQEKDLPSSPEPGEEESASEVEDAGEETGQNQ